MNLQLVLLHLSLIKNIGPGLVQKLLAYCGPDSLKEVYQFVQSDLIKLIGLTECQAAILTAGLANTDQLYKEIDRAEKLGIKWLTIADNNYPSILKEINSPPIILYYQGTAPHYYKKSLAIVGSRKAGLYAESVINDLIPPLVANEWAIVSGGAIGADSLAHQAALQSCGKTVAIIGSGLVRPYPSRNQKLFDAIIANGGTLMSPFNLDMGPLPGNFPARNRIISGLSRGCLVVQAAEKSGAKITALFALEQGREVFAIPGSIFDELSTGCHQLIQQGAKLVFKPDDIMQEFGESIDQHKTVSKPVSDRLAQQNIEPVTIAERIIYQCKKPTSLDELIDLTGSNLSEMHSLLFNMQLQGKIRQDISGLWIAN
jgi:DNA processing protein